MQLCKYFKLTEQKNQKINLFKFNKYTILWSRSLRIAGYFYLYNITIALKWC